MSKKSSIQVDILHYEFPNYVSQRRWISFYWQMYFIHLLKIKSVLEIGPGGDILKLLLTKKIVFKTLDIDKRLKPDYVGSVLEIPIKENRFGCVICCQVLEHLPFKDFEQALCELNRVTKKNIILSLPYARLYLSLKLHLYKHFCLKMTPRVPQFWRIHKFDGEHYWEIGKKGHSYYRVKKILEKYFMIKKSFFPIDNPYHQFFILEKK